MTVETYTPPAPYVIATTGPYAIPFPYRTGTVAAFVTLATGVRQRLTAGQYTVTPASSVVGGNLTLASTVGVVGLSLEILRETPLEQGWEAAQSGREDGLEAQLDATVLRVQEIQHIMGRAMVLPFPAQTMIPSPGRVIAWGQNGQPYPGPLISDISAAQANAAAAAEDAADAALAAASAAVSAAAAGDALGQIMARVPRQWLGSRAAAIAEPIAVAIDRIALRHMTTAGEVTLYYMRDPAATHPALTDANGGKWVPDPVGGHATVHHFGAVGGDSVADTAAFTAARDWFNAGGGSLRIPRGDYTVTAKLVFARNSAALFGDGGNATIIRGGGSLHYGKCFDFAFYGLSVLGATGTALSIGVETGTQTYAAWFRAHDLKSNFPTGSGFVIGDAFMGDIFGIRSQQSGNGLATGTGPEGIRFEPGTFRTSLSIRDCHSVDANGPGWRIENTAYSDISNIGCDRARGYGIILKDLHNVRLHFGCEDAAYSALKFEYDAAASNPFAKGFNALHISGWEKDCNEGWNKYPKDAPPPLTMFPITARFAHFTSSLGTAAPGTVIFENCSHHGTFTGTSLHIESGAYEIIWPRNSNRLSRQVVGGWFSAIMDADNHMYTLSAIPITAADTPIAKVGPRLMNGVDSFGGVLTIYASQNTGSSNSRPALYELRLLAGIGVPGLDTMTLASATGHTTGASADAASFTFSFDFATRTLRASPVGATSGNFFFHIHWTGNLSVEPA